MSIWSEDEDLLRNPYTDCPPLNRCPKNIGLRLGGHKVILTQILFDIIIDMSKARFSKKQNEISHIYLKGSDLAEREREVLEDASKRLGFAPEKIISRSNWWTSKEIGAFFCLGTYRNQKTMLKIQGVKTTVSEIYMINAFKKANKSKFLRPPYLYASLPWNDEKRYEALVLEPVEKRVVQTPTNEKELNNFFNAYLEYRQNCLGNPWLEVPKDSISQRISDNFKIWRKASFKLYPTHPLRESADGKLIDKAVEILKKGYQNVNFEFQHGHFSEGDLYQKDSQIVLLSNLYWGWKPPLYDAVFGMHWFIYHLADVKDITPEIIEEQRKLWFEKIESLPGVKANEKLYNLALLERAAAGLNLDSLSVGTEDKIASYLVDKTREQVQSLIQDLKT